MHALTSKPGKRLDTAVKEVRAHVAVRGAPIEVQRAERALVVALARKDDAQVELCLRFNRHVHSSL